MGLRTAPWTEHDSERGTAVVNDRRRGLGKGLGALIPTTPTDILSERTRTDAAAATPAPPTDSVSRETVSRETTPGAFATLAPPPTAPALVALPIDHASPPATMATVPGPTPSPDAGPAAEAFEGVDGHGARPYRAQQAHRQAIDNGGEMLNHLQTALIGRMQILEHNHHRSSSGQAFDERDESVGQAARGRLLRNGAIVPAGHLKRGRNRAQRLGMRARQVAQDIGRYTQCESLERNPERPEGHVRPIPVCSTPQSDDVLLGGKPFELGHQAALS